MSRAPRRLHAVGRMSQRQYRHPPLRSRWPFRLRLPIGFQLVSRASGRPRRSRRLQTNFEYLHKTRHPPERLLNPPPRQRPQPSHSRHPRRSSQFPTRYGGCKSAKGADFRFLKAERSASIASGSGKNFAIRPRMRRRQPSQLRSLRPPRRMPLCPPFSPKPGRSGNLGWPIT